MSPQTFLLQTRPEPHRAGAPQGHTVDKRLGTSSWAPDQGPGRAAGEAPTALVPGSVSCRQGGGPGAAQKADRWWEEEVLSA